MSVYHDLTLLFETASEVLSDIVEREALADARLERWRRKDLGVPVLTLTWRADDNIARNLHIGAIDEPHELIVEIEINAWQDVERRKRRGKPRKFRRMINEGIGNLRHVEQQDSQGLSRAFTAVLWQAYGVVSRMTAEDLQDVFRRNPDEEDPGPIRVQDWLAE